MGSFFVNPAFVASGAALIASPIIIHLINRLRFRRVRFAAMEFLLQSQQRNRRRILIEQLILLLLRILLVLFIMLLIARLILSPTQLSLLTGEASAHHVILIDDSGSMQEVSGDESAFARAKKMARRLVERSATESGTQNVTVLLLSKPHTALFREQQAGQKLVKDVITSFENVTCTHRRLDLVEGMNVAAKLLEEGESKRSIKHLHVISDFRDEDWKSKTAAAETVERLTEKGISVNFLRAVESARPNVAVTRLTGDVATAAAGVPMKVHIGVTNFGTKPVENVPARLVADGKRLPRIVLFEKLEPGIESVKETYVHFREEGPHRLRVILPVDPLQSDNARFLAVERLPRVNHILLIDGDPQARDARFVEEAIAANPSITGIEVEVHDPDWLRRNPLDRFQCIYMLNVPQLDPDAVKPVREYVEQGGGIAWFVGDLVNATHYNSKLFDYEIRKDDAGKIVSRRATGLFPVPLSITSAQLDPRPPGKPGADLQVVGRHPIFKDLLDIEQGALLELLNIRRYWPVARQLPGNAGDWLPDDNQRKDGVSTIARLSRETSRFPNGEPILFEHQLGNGHVVTCLTSAGRAWTDWAAKAIYAVIQLEIRRQIARRPSDRKRLVGQPVDEILPTSVYTDSVEIGSPESPGEYTPRRVGSPVKQPAGSNEPGDEAYPLTYNETDRPGIYTLILTRHKAADDSGSTRETRMFAYNVPVEESATQLAPSEDIRKAMPTGDGFQLHEFGSETPFEGKEPGQEIRRILLFVIVVLLMGEQLLAYRLSYHTRDT